MLRQRTHTNVVQYANYLIFIFMNMNEKFEMRGNEEILWVYLQNKSYLIY